MQQKGLQLLLSPSKEEEEGAEGGFCESHPSNCYALDGFRSAMAVFLRVNAKKELFYSAAFFILLACTVSTAEQASADKSPQCHNYAGGHVYPGEAFRVPGSDHSLHLSKAKSEPSLSPTGDQFTGVSLQNA